jgi:hypothetical protein
MQSTKIYKGSYIKSMLCPERNLRFSPSQAMCVPHSSWCWRFWCLQDYWPAVAKFTQHYAHSLEAEPEDDQSNAGVQEAVQATNAGVKPPSAVGPFTDGSSRPSQVHDEQDAGAALQAPGHQYKKEL